MIDQGITHKYSKIVNVWAKDSLSFLADVALISAGLPIVENTREKNIFHEESKVTNEELNVFKETDNDSYISYEESNFSRDSDNTLNSSITIQGNESSSSSDKEYMQCFHDGEYIEEDTLGTNIPIVENGVNLLSSHSIYTSNSIPELTDQKMFIIDGSTSIVNNKHLLFNLKNHNIFSENSYQLSDESKAKGYTLSIRSLSDVHQAELNMPVKVSSFPEIEQTQVTQTILPHIVDATVIPHTGDAKAIPKSIQSYPINSFLKNETNSTDNLNTNLLLVNKTFNCSGKKSDSRSKHASPISRYSKLYPRPNWLPSITKFNETETMKCNGDIEKKFRSCDPNQKHEVKGSTSIELYSVKHVKVIDPESDHAKEPTTKDSYTCSICGRGYSTSSNLARHR